LQIGSCICTNNGFANGAVFIAVAFDRVPMVAFTHDQDHLFLTLRVTDDKNATILWIEENQLRYSISPWDIESVGRNIVIREKARDILIDIVFDPPNVITIRRGRLLLNGLELHITPDQVCFANNFLGFSRCDFVADVALMYGEMIEGSSGAIHIPVTNRNSVDRDAARKWMQQMGQNYTAINKKKREPEVRKEKKTRKKRKQEKANEDKKGKLPIDPK
jgi:hypothetical protein